MCWMVRVERLSKEFTLHTQGGIRLPVLEGFDLTVAAGELVILRGPSGAGKSTLLKLLYGNYRAKTGAIWVRHGERLVDMVSAEPHVILEVRRRTMGYVSQFLRVIPRVPALRIVMEPLRALGVTEPEARERAARLLGKLRVPERLWGLSPTTFSGGEQQRINLARSFVAAPPVMLLDEPTASLDPLNRQLAVDLINQRRQAGAAMIAIAHDGALQDADVTRIVDMD
jgi:alpha-D-ribose 1-methylphosphonate 5-triphosphate synthase subunit PhnL